MKPLQQLTLVFAALRSAARSGRPSCCLHAQALPQEPGSDALLATTSAVRAIQAQVCLIDQQVAAAATHAMRLRTRDRRKQTSLRIDLHVLLGCLTQKGLCAARQLMPKQHVQRLT